MNEEDESMKCLCCNEKKEALIQVMLKKDSIFMHSRGICQDCVKTRDINKICSEFEIRKTKKAIQESEQGLESLKEHLEQLKK